MIGFGVAFAALASFAWREHHRRVESTEGQARASDVASLELEIARLKGKVAAVEARSATAAALPPPTPSATAPTAAPAPPAVPPRHPTHEEQVARFESYFATLDGVRGAREDEGLTKRFADTLKTVTPGFTTLQGSTVDLVSCGNGLCRVELTFPNMQELALGRNELLMQLRSVAEASTMYADIDKPHLAAYFAAAGTTLPPFPTAND
jgi:hypothetical protein